MKAAKPIIVLTTIAAAAAALLSLVNTGTAASRDAADRDFKLASLMEVLPEYGNKPDEEVIEAEVGGKKVQIYTARESQGEDGKLVGVAVELFTPVAYGGAIGMLVGVNAEHEVHGIKILPGHRETPGLGAKVEEEGWRSQFHGLSLASSEEEGWTFMVRKDDPAGKIDEVTGATITSRAVTSTVEDALEIVGGYDDLKFRLDSLPLILPEHDNKPEEEAVEVDLGKGKKATLYTACLGNEFAGVAVEIETPPAYAGVVKLLVGVDPGLKVTGVRVFPGHEETPGSGDLVEDVEWLAKFEGKTLAEKGKVWKVTGDVQNGIIDEITGATVTCKAVVEGVRNALEVVANNRTRCE